MQSKIYKYGKILISKDVLIYPITNRIKTYTKRLQSRFGLYPRDVLTLGVLLLNILFLGLLVFISNS